MLPETGRFVRNPAYGDGQATSLAAAFHDVDDDSEAAVVLMADQPGVTAGDVRALMARFRATRKQIVRLRFSDAPAPRCSVARSMRKPATCTATSAPGC